MKSVISVLLLVLIPTLSAQEEKNYTAEIWKTGKDTLVEVTELEETRTDLPNSKWFSRDRKDLDQDIDKLLDEVLEVLGVSGLTEARDEYIALGERIDARRTEIRELREASLSAPADKSPLEFYKKTRETYREEIEALEKDIASLQVRQDDMVRKLRSEYKEMGLELSEEQVRFYLASVSGEDMMALSSVFHNVRDLNLQLEELVRQSPDDPEAARRYYGIHVALIRSMLRAHEVTLENIDERYLIRIDDLDQQNRTLREETRQLIRFAEPDQKGLLEASLRTQNVTQDALELYREHLKSVRDRIYEGKKSLDRRYEVAQNAYHTIRISSALASEMQAAVKDLNALRAMHLPDMIPLNDEALQRKFSEITRELRGE